MNFIFLFLISLLFLQLNLSNAYADKFFRCVFNRHDHAITVFHTNTSSVENRILRNYKVDSLKSEDKMGWRTLEDTMTTLIVVDNDNKAISNETVFSNLEPWHYYMILIYSYGDNIQPHKIIDLGPAKVLPRNSARMIFLNMAESNESLVVETTLSDDSNYQSEPFGYGEAYIDYVQGYSNSVKTLKTRAQGVGKSEVTLSNPNILPLVDWVFLLRHPGGAMDVQRTQWTNDVIYGYFRVILALYDAPEDAKFKLLFRDDATGLSAWNTEKQYGLTFNNASEWIVFTNQQIGSRISYAIFHGNQTVHWDRNEAKFVDDDNNVVSPWFEKLNRQVDLSADDVFRDFIYGPVNDVSVFEFDDRSGSLGTDMKDESDWAQLLLIPDDSVPQTNFLLVSDYGTENAKEIIMVDQGVTTNNRAQYLPMHAHNSNSDVPADTENRQWTVVWKLFPQNLYLIHAPVPSDRMHCSASTIVIVYGDTTSGHGKIMFVNEDAVRGAPPGWCANSQVQTTTGGDGTAALVSTTRDVLTLPPTASLSSSSSSPPGQTTSLLSTPSNALDTLTTGSNDGNPATLMSTTKANTSPIDSNFGTASLPNVQQTSANNNSSTQDMTLTIVAFVLAGLFLLCALLFLVLWLISKKNDNNESSSSSIEMQSSNEVDNQSSPVYNSLRDVEPEQPVYTTMTPQPDDVEPIVYSGLGAD